LAQAVVMDSIIDQSTAILNTTPPLNTTYPSRFHSFHPYISMDHRYAWKTRMEVMDTFSINFQDMT